MFGDITMGGCFYRSDERVRFTSTHARLFFSLSLLFFLLLLSLPASRARREKKMRGSRSFIPRRMLRRNYHAARSRRTRASEHIRAHVYARAILIEMFTRVCVRACASRISLFLALFKLTFMDYVVSLTSTLVLSIFFFR